MGIFDDIGRQLSMAEIISKHFWFKLEDFLSSYICSMCWHKINDFHGFYQSVEKTHEKFRIMRQDLAFVKENLTLIKDEDNYAASIIKQEEQDEKTLTNVGKQMQFEIEIDIANSDSVKNPLEEIERSESCDSDKGTDNETSGDYQPYKTHIEKVACDKKTKLNKVDKKNKTKKKYTVPNTKNKKKKIIFNRLDPTHTEEMIKKHIPMGCNLCVFVGKTFSDIVSHFKTEHPNTRAYITCCDKKFTKRFYVAQHAMTHENPDCFSCKVCNKSFTTTGGLQKHNLNYHAPEEDRTFVCELCPKKFARKHLLQLHKTSHIPREEWNVFCTKCPTPKAFASAYLLNIHDNKLHRREKNICNVCAKEIKDKKSFEKHVKEHYEGSGPRIKCHFPNCDSWLKDEDNLKLHIRRHNPDGKTYKCPQCNKICPNRRALSSHKVYVHSNEIFRCERCEKTFKKAISLKEHMTQHTGEILYNCPFCPKTFNSNANMHSHKKKQHPVEWQELRRQKRFKNPDDVVLNMGNII